MLERKTKIKKIKLPIVKVKNSGLILPETFSDFPDGQLSIINSPQQIPFKIKRLYYINQLFNENAKRGHHAHKNLEQVIFCLNGSFRLKLDDGLTKQSIILTKSSYGVRLGRMLWHEMDKFSSDCVIMVAAADYYKESDYIRDYNQFLKLIDKIS